MRSELREEGIKVDWNNSRKLLDTPKVFPILAKCIQKTKRFVHFHSYAQDKNQGKRSQAKGERRKEG